MPIFQQSDDGNLHALARQVPGADFVEAEIEQLAARDLEAFTGESLFVVARQPLVSRGQLKPDILALDSDGRVVVIEVKRDFDRNQLAQCLEYAGWARSTNTDEIARLYKHTGGGDPIEAFLAAWKDFTQSATPLLITAQPRLFLIAGRFDDRTQAAVEYLRESGVPLETIPVGVYSDASGKRFFHIDTDFEPAPPSAVESTVVLTRKHLKVNGRRILLSDLIAEKLIEPPEGLTWHRMRAGDTFAATVSDSGTVVLADGREFQSPSAAATAASGSQVDGWTAWGVDRLGGRLIHDLRDQYFARYSGHTP